MLDERTATNSNARSLLLTILGDLVLPTTMTVSGAALSRTMSLTGVNDTDSAAALKALIKEEFLVSNGDGYTITGTGRRRLEEAAERIYLRRSLQWDGRWHLLSYQASENDRRALQDELTWLGYGRIGSSLWACPWDLDARVDAVLAKHGVSGDVEMFTSRADGGDDAGLAKRAYDLKGLGAQYRNFVQRFDDDRHCPQELSDDQALVQRITLVHEWRKFLFTDPGLPNELTPADWMGEEAAKLFIALYERYEAQAWRAWTEISGAATQSSTNLRPAPSFTFREQATDEQRTQEFRERIDAGQKIEATDWMPQEYRRVAFKFIEMHANSELMGALPERDWIPRAPTLHRKRSLAAKVQDEVGHAQLIYRAAEELGIKTRPQMAADLLAGKTKFHNVFHYPTKSWADVACIGFLVDGAAIVTQKALLNTSYAVYLRIMRRVVAEESLHYRHGEDIMLALASGTDEQFEMLQEAVLRWWTPILHFFGHDTPAEKDVALQWQIKTQTNEAARQQWMSTYIPKLWDMGIELPDPDLRYDPEADHWDYTEPDWDEMNAIIRGQGPMTQQRLGYRRLMRENSAWVQQVITGEQLARVA